MVFMDHRWIKDSLLMGKVWSTWTSRVYVFKNPIMSHFSGGYPAGFLQIWHIATRKKRWGAATAPECSPTYSPTFSPTCYGAYGDTCPNAPCMEYLNIYLYLHPPRVSNFSPQVCFWWLRGSSFRPLRIQVRLI